MNFKILELGPPIIFDGYPDTAWSDGEPNTIEWEIHSVAGDRENTYKPGQRILWRTLLQHPFELHREVPVICEFLIEAVGSEGNLYGWGMAEWSDGIPLQRPFGRRPDVYLD